ncbi:MAG: adenosylcobinamide amidohydrolase [Lachnospiraceae bacterium]|nr:adenosylcobinamide amidohydrolase [Lachnospiraceae bacterium]
MLIHTFANQDTLYQSKKSLLLTFSRKRNVLSTSAFHGGFRSNLNCIFNFDEKPEKGKYCKMLAPTYEEHLLKIALDKLHLDPACCTGLSTAASMENLAIETETTALPDTVSESSSFTVTAVVTGGIDKNGARIGDPACWQEIDGNYFPIPGTINIFLHIDANLTPGAMARALMTCTEAKAAACEELFCPSLYSEGLATGSGTDGIILIANPDSPVRLCSAGKDSKLGEMIGRSVLRAVKKAIGLQTGVTSSYQHHALRRLDRFGFTESIFYSYFQKIAANKTFLTKEEFHAISDPLLSSGEWTTKASLSAHLLDQLNTGMLSGKEVLSAVKLLFPINESSSESYRLVLAEKEDNFKEEKFSFEQIKEYVFFLFTLSFYCSL